MAVVLVGLSASGCASQLVSFPPNPDASEGVDAVTATDVVVSPDGQTPDGATAVDAVTVDRASTDARADAPVDVPVTSACSLVGAWYFDIGGDGAYLVFRSTLQWELTYDPTDPKFTVTGGTYRLTGDHLTLREDTVDSACDPSDVGEYVLRFAPSCDALTLGLVSDDCSGRGETLDTLALSREAL